ncbi:hypothetical protein ACGF12_03630 [Kitasatospora sp. NPDC048296]|uniref:hypothetical protein n=1 Tax=Kitasatospora sp. NPDC048296 TaxID=3364048 RepID=UPI00371E5002
MLVLQAIFSDMVRRLVPEKALSGRLCRGAIKIHVHINVVLKGSFATMKRVTRAGIALGFAAATAVLSVAPAQADTAAPGSTTMVCADTPTPAGYVDLGWRPPPGCWMMFPGGVRVIEKVDGLPIGTQVDACADSPIPAGWTIVKSYLDNSGLACLTVNGVSKITLQRTS